MPGKKKGGGKKKSSKGKKSKGKADKGGKEDDMKQILDERFYMGPHHERNRERALKEKINRAFKMFERPTERLVDPGERVCEDRDVKTIVRSLDLNPTKEQIRMMMDEIEEPEPCGYIKYHKLEALMLEILKTNEYVPKGRKFEADSGQEYQSTLLVRDSEDRIIEAFRTLDRTKQGFLDAEVFGNLMMDREKSRKDEQFEREEVVDMIQAAADPETGAIKYEDSLYVDQLAYD